MCVKCIIVLVLAGIPEEPFRTMVLLAMCLGLRSCELVGLKWCDVDWTNLMLRVRRNVVDGRVDAVKTRKSEAEVPLDPSVAEILLAWKRKAPFADAQDWLFASPAMGGRLPYLARGIQQLRIRPAAEDAGLGDGIGWHTFRHTYRRMLSKTGAAMDVQRDLMRHASITTTIDVYGSMGEQEEYFEPMRTANSAVVKQVLK
jgi:integrase